MNLGTGIQLITARIVSDKKHKTLKNTVKKKKKNDKNSFKY